MTYSQLTICGLINILAIVSLVARDNQPKQLAWQQVQQQQASISGKAAIEQSRVEQSKSIADTYAKNQIANVPTLLIQGYTLSDTPPTGIDWWHSVSNPNAKTFIFDQFRKCIGYAQSGQLHFVKTDPTACEAEKP